MEIGKLKLLCQRLFKLPAAKQALFLKNGGENPIPDNIGEDDSRDLLFFSVEELPRSTAPPCGHAVGPHSHVGDSYTECCQDLNCPSLQ